MLGFHSVLRHSTLACCATIALGACLAPFGHAQAQQSPPPIRRALPNCVHHLEESGILVLSGQNLALGSASLIDGEWHRKGNAVETLARVQDGVLVNNGVTTALLISLDGLSVYAVEPGESIVVGADATPGYTKGCVCRCGEGWIFIAAQDCGGSNCQCQQVVGPCIDPSNQQLVEAGVTGCKPGWGR